MVSVPSVLLRRCAHARRPQPPRFDSNWHWTFTMGTNKEGGHTERRRAKAVCSTLCWPFLACPFPFSNRLISSFKFGTRSGQVHRFQMIHQKPAFISQESNNTNLTCCVFSDVAALVRPVLLPGTACLVHRVPIDLREFAVGQSLLVALSPPLRESLPHSQSTHLQR